MSMANEYQNEANRVFTKLMTDWYCMRHIKENKLVHTCLSDAGLSRQQKYDRIMNYTHSAHGDRMFEQSLYHAVMFSKL